MVGLITDEKHITPSHFIGQDDAVILVGGIGSEMGGSAYLAEIHGKKKGRPPRMELAKEKKFQDATRAAIRGGLVRSAHDISDGGLAVALAECCIPCGMGARIDLNSRERVDAILFNESQGRAVLSTLREKVDALLGIFQERGVEAALIGWIASEGIMAINVGGRPFSWRISDLKKNHQTAIPNEMGG
jgi:phosphoribosylformylglycinamidine synthase